MPIAVAPATRATSGAAVASTMTAGVFSTAGASHLAVDLAGGGFSALLPSIAERLSLSSTAFGALVALFAVSSLGSQPLMGGLADRAGVRQVTAIAAVVAASVLAAAALVNNIVLLVAAIVVGGLASAAFHPAGAVLARASGSTSPENSLAIFAAAGTVGLALGPIAALALAGDEPGGHILLLAIPSALIAPIIWWRTSGALPTSQEQRHRDTPSSTQPLLRGELLRLAAAATLVAIASTSVGSTLPLWIAEQPGRSATDSAIGWALASFSLAAAAGGITGGRLAGRVGAFRLLRSTLLASSIPALVLGLTPPATPLSFAALVLTGLLLGPAIPLLLVAAQNAAPERAATASGMVMGLSHGLAGVAFIGVSMISSVVGHGLGMLAGVGALVPAALLIRPPAITNDRQLAETVKHLLATCGCISNMGRECRA